MSFGENLRKIRKQRNITQEELAELLNVSRQAISKWEAGNGYPETEKLILIFLRGIAASGLKDFYKNARCKELKRVYENS